ncbi:enoyl-CoA hydratase/carnithine racemase [Streptomyces tendae]
MPSLDRQENVFVLDLGDGENRFHPDWIAAFGAALDEVEKADGPRALVTAATGKFWSNGLDLEWLTAHADDYHDYVVSVHQLFARVLSLPLVTVAALQGHTFAAGAMLSLAHDFRVMRADRGYWCLPEADINIPFTPGMSALIQSRLTPRTAHEAMITARRYGGADAASAGIVDRAVPRGRRTLHGDRTGPGPGQQGGRHRRHHQVPYVRPGPVDPARHHEPARLTRPSVPGVVGPFLRGAPILGVDALGFLELVLEDDDPARGLDRRALVDELARPGRDPQLVTGVPPVPALGAQRGDQPRLAERAEEARCGAEHLGGPAHRVGGVVVVVQPVAEWGICHVTSMCNASRGPAPTGTGPRTTCNTIGPPRRSAALAQGSGTHDSRRRR